jgi:NitT/TauT family transport system ATP-binding protein
VPELDTISGPPAKIRLADVGIVFRPRDREPVVAVRDFTFDVPEGSIVTIVGPSGCGKSTILNIVSGLMPPSRGKVEVDGRPVTGIRHDVGYMFARDGMMPWRTAIENVAFGLEVRGIANRNEIAREWLRKVGLDRFEGHYRHELSQGMRQRVAVARTFAIEPNILLMDEPFGALDTHTKINLHVELLALWESRRQTVVFVTHDLSEAITLADRIVVMTRRPGRVKLIHTVKLARPRDVIQLRETEAYAHEYGALWHVLGEEFAERA